VEPTSGVGFSNWGEIDAAGPLPNLVEIPVKVNHPGARAYLVALAASSQKIEYIPQL